jgi:type IV secretion system protein VirB10
MTEQELDRNSVLGERGDATVARTPSVQSRVSNVLAIGLMSLLGLGMLTWYYANTLTRQSRARQGVQSLSSKRAQNDLPLPSLGRIDPPPAIPAPEPETVTAPSALSMPLQEIPLNVTPAAASAAAPAKTQAQLALDRQLSGVVYSPQSTLPAAPGVNGNLSPPQEPGDLTALLRPTLTTTVRAQVLPTQRLLLPKGAFLDCTLETAIDSTLPGMTTCVMATDTFGVDGQVVLLERGTKLVGETRGQVQQGSARVFVLWDEARTPTGVIVPLASPGADELGRSGLPGTVDRHFLGTIRCCHAGDGDRWRGSKRCSVEPRQ